MAVNFLDKKKRASDGTFRAHRIRHWTGTAALNIGQLELVSLTATPKPMRPFAHSAFFFRKAFETRNSAEVSKSKRFISSDYNLNLVEWSFVGFECGLARAETIRNQNRLLKPGQTCFAFP